MVDTMHIHSNGEDVAGVVGEYLTEIAELQLRDTDSKPPGQGRIDFTSVLKVVREKFKGLICLEYKPGPSPGADFNHACKFVEDIISAAR
jgi:sugar phosphate isomerase/epimerase